MPHHLTDLVRVMKVNAIPLDALNLVWFSADERRVIEAALEPDDPQPLRDPLPLSEEQERFAYHAEEEDNDRQFGSEDDRDALASAGWVEEE